MKSRTSNTFKAQRKLWVSGARVNTLAHFNQKLKKKNPTPSPDHHKKAKSLKRGAVIKVTPGFSSLASAVETVRKGCWRVGRVLGEQSAAPKGQKEADGKGSADTALKEKQGPAANLHLTPRLLLNTVSFPIRTQRF